MRYIFWNAKVIAQSPDHHKMKWPTVAGGRCQKNWSFTVIKSIAIEFVPAMQVGLGVNTIIGDVMAPQNSQSAELLSSDDPTWFADWVSGASRVWHCACPFPNVIGIVNRGTTAIHRKYQSSDLNKSIAISIIDRHVHRWFAAKLTFGQERRLIRSVACPGSQRWSH